jgi:hypothetical protein
LRSSGIGAFSFRRLKLKKGLSFETLSDNYNQLMMDEVQDRVINNTTLSSNTFREEVNFLFCHACGISCPSHPCFLKSDSSS